MRPQPWNPPIELSAQEQKIVKLIKRAKIFVFLRQSRHILFDEAFQEELGKMYADSSKGHPPVPPAQLALATILQAYTGASDAEAIEALTMDKRWQLVLDCLEEEQAPFCGATLVRFRAALMIHQLDRRLIERTVEVAQKSKQFGDRQLRAALDSSPLWGAAKVEDTYNLLGHALKKASFVIANQQGRELAEVATEAGAGIVATSSLKAALDLDWDDPDERTRALEIVLRALHSVEAHRSAQPEVNEHRGVRFSLEAAQQVVSENVEVGEGGFVKLRQGVAKNRRISIEDEQMKHGRKSRTSAH